MRKVNLKISGNKIKRLYREGMPKEKIAKIYKISYSTINKYFKELRIKKIYKVKKLKITGRKRSQEEERRWQEFRKKVLKKFNFTCILCNKKPAREVHHIKKVSDYPELEYDINNVLLLCLKCHREQHPELNSFLFKFRYWMWHK